MKTWFGVPPLGGAAWKPPKGGTPNLPQRDSMVVSNRRLGFLLYAKMARGYGGLPF